MMKHVFNPTTGKLDRVSREFTFFDLMSVWRLGTLRRFLEDPEDFSLINGGNLSDSDDQQVFFVGSLEDL